MSTTLSVDVAVTRTVALFHGRVMESTIYNHGLAASGATETLGEGVQRDLTTKTLIEADETSVGSVQVLV